MCLSCFADDTILSTVKIQATLTYFAFMCKNKRQTDLFAPNGTHPNAKNVSSEQIRLLKTKIEQTAQKILDARAKYPDSSLADLYDETVMPPELRKAHQENDRAVMQAYGFNPKMTESEIVAELFKMYERLTKGE